MAARKVHPENTPEGKKAKAVAEAADAAVAAQPQAQIDSENERGLRGVEVDSTPNEAYTLAGVIRNQPTPETDRDAAAAARQGQLLAERAVAGVGER